MMRTPFFIFAPGFGVDDTGGLRRQAHVQRQIIGSGDDLVKRYQLDAVLASHSGGNKRIAADNVQTKSAGALRNFKPDPAQAENAQSFAAQFPALQTLLLPLSCMHRCVGSGQLARQRKHQAERELGDGNGVCTRRIHHDNAASRSCFGIDVVDTNPARPTTRSFGACSISASSTCTAERTTSASASASAAARPSGS